MKKLIKLWLQVNLVCCALMPLIKSHDAKDLDDSILYKIDFEIPDFEQNPELKSQIMTFHTHDKEKYDCVIPKLEEKKEELEAKDQELSPFVLIEPLFTARSCSYRIEAYWSYEICHGMHVRQYHEEREGKNIKFQEFYLGKWNEEKSAKVKKEWEENRKAGMKIKTTRIDTTRYPYFELEMTDGTSCDILDNAPRTTVVRYVCYPHGKNEIYSFKETSSCNYEAIILTSALCMIPAFHPDESKEISIKCFNSPVEPHKPLSMLRQELNDMKISDDDFPVSKDANKAAAALALAVSNSDRFMLVDKLDNNVNKFVLELMANGGIDLDTSAAQGTSSEILPAPATPTHVPFDDLTPIKEFISGKNCLIGGTGWWKYEFCYGRHVRQFHKDKQSETELYLGYFSEAAHRQWIIANPEKSAKRTGYSASLWHHYEKGTRCDRTNLPREVDVKLTCTPISISATTVSMYLLEPKTCVYILVVESPIICDLIQIADQYGLVNDQHLQELLKRDKLSAEADLIESPAQDSEELLTLPEDVRS